MRVLFGSDGNGRPLMIALVAYVRSVRPDDEVDIVEVSGSPDYPDVASTVAQNVRAGRFDRGVLCCGTGAGMAIVANKIPGVRAVCLGDRLTAEQAITSNDARVATFGNDVVSPELAIELLRIWLENDFHGGTSSRKVARICEIESDASAALEWRSAKGD